MFSLGRSVNINYPSNRWMAIISLLIAIVMSIFLKSVNEGLFIAVGFFLCWALAREIDPKHDKSAFVAGLLFVVTTFFMYDDLQIALIFWLLLSIRLISKICGRIPTLFDLITVVGISGYLAYALASPIFMSLTVLALIFAWFRYDKAKLYIIVAALAVILTAIFSIIIPWQFSEIFNLIILENNISIVLLITISIIFLLYFQMRVLAWNKSYDDDLGGILKYAWLQLALGFFGIALIGIILFVNVSYSSLFLLISTVIGVNLHALYIIFNRRISVN